MPDVRLLATISASARTVAWLYAAASVLSGFGAAYCGMAIAQAIQ